MGINEFTFRRTVLTGNTNGNVTNRANQFIGCGGRRFLFGEQAGNKRAKPGREKQSSYNSQKRY